MDKNKLNLRNVVAIAIYLVAMTMFASCEKEDNKLLVGKWFTSDFHAGNSGVIEFTEDFYAREYFGHILASQIIPALYAGPYVTYSLSGKNITFTLHISYPIAEKISETFTYVLNGDTLLIKGFSNPFSGTDETRTDVHFTRVERKP